VVWRNTATPIRKVLASSTIVGGSFVARAAQAPATDVSCPPVDADNAASNEDISISVRKVVKIQ
jgi:hypothetical protein